jgi:hypothetical protein
LDEGSEKAVQVSPDEPVWLARGLGHGTHTFTLSTDAGGLSVDSIAIVNRSRLIPWLLAAAALLVVGAVAHILTSRRRHPPEPGPFRRVRR